MVDGVEFNPFTQKAFTPEEIKKLDTDGDGKISKDEFSAGISWLSGTSDDDGDVIIDTVELSDKQQQMYTNAKNNGIKDTAQDKAELSEFLTILQDEYLEAYFKATTGLLKEDKASLSAFVASNAAEFLDAFLKKNPEGPYDMKAILADFSNSMDTSISDRKTMQTTVNNQIDDLKNNDDRLAKLGKYTQDANSDYLTGTEYNKVVQDTSKYLLGELLNGNDVSEFMANLNKNYASNSNYKIVMDAIKVLQTSQDPAEMKAALEKATNAMNEFVKSVGKEKLVGGIENTRQSAAETELEGTLNTVADSYIEKLIALTNEARAAAGFADQPMSDEEVAQITKFVKNSVGTYIAEMAEKFPDLTSMDTTNLAVDFAAYVDNKRLKLAQTQQEIAAKAGDMTGYYNNLVSASDKANADKYITGDEKKTLVNAGKDFILSQLLNGMENIALMNALNPGYKGTTEFKEITNIMNSMKTETDPEKAAELYKKLEDTITKMLDKFDGAKLTKAVDSLKPVQVDDKTKDTIISKSSIATDCETGVSRSGGYGKQNDESLAEIQGMAKKDLEAIAESMKAQLKAQLGAAYNEADVTRYINDAITDTLSEFTNGVSRRNGKGNYQSAADHKGFEFLRRSGTKKGRYTYNVQSLVNTFIQKFNETSVKKNAAKIDPNLATYDKENVIANSLGNDYDRNKTEKVYGKNDDQKAYAELIDKAKAQLKSVAAATKASMIAEGVPLSSAEIDKILDEAINDTITDMKSAFQYCQPGGTVTGGIAKGLGSAAGGVATGVGVATGLGAAGFGLAGGSLATGAALGAGSVFGGAMSSGIALTATVPVVGWVAAGVMAAGLALKSFTNLFGASYGKHNENAGFFFERKSNSHSGNWGYDTKTLVDTFMARIDQKVAEAKEKKKADKDKDTATEILVTTKPVTTT